MSMGEVGRTVRLGIIGLGGRGMGQTETLLQMKDVEPQEYVNVQNLPKCAL